MNKKKKVEHSLLKSEYENVSHQKDVSHQKGWCESGLDFSAMWLGSYSTLFAGSRGICGKVD